MAYKTAVIGVVKSNSVLIIERGATAPWMPLHWSLVGGLVEDGESFKSAASRECYEETGFRVKNIKKIMDFDDPDPKWGGEYQIFTGEPVDPTREPKLDYENSNYAWVTEQELHNYKFVPFALDFIKKIL
jgi:8-oxo-dGTP pyrophosphatase MutT (NUDIX family)